VNVPGVVLPLSAQTEIRTFAGAWRCNYYATTTLASTHSKQVGVRLTCKPRGW